MTIPAPLTDLDALIRDSHRIESVRPSAALPRLIEPLAAALGDEGTQPSALRRAQTRAEIRKGLALRAVGTLVWTIGLALFAFGVAPHVGGLEWGADPAIAIGALFGLIGFGLAERAERHMPSGGLAEYVRCCDPDFSQSWAVGIALGGGDLGCGGGGDGGGGC